MRSLQFSPDGRETYSATSFFSAFPLVAGDWIERRDFASNTVIQQADIRVDALAVSFKPLAPVNLSAAAIGSEVRLTWGLAGASPAATRFILEAGSRSGSSDLAVLDVAAAALTVRGVPPGRYFVRVRAANAVGVGDPSGEIVVDVGRGAALPRDRNSSDLRD